MAHSRDELTRLIVSRANAGLVMCAISISLFALSDPFLHPTVLPALALTKALMVATIVGAYFALRRAPTGRYALVIAVTTVIVMGTGTAVSGIFTNDPMTTPLVLVLLSMGTATMLPWGVQAQIAVQLGLAGAAVLNLEWVGTLALGTYVPVALIVMSLAAVYVQYLEEGQRRTMRRRDAATARAQAEHRVVDAAHAARLASLGGMAGGLAHELNQPLAAIVSYASGCVRRLEAGEVSPDTLLPIILEMRTQALRAGEVIRRLREFLQPGTRRGRVDVNHVVREATKLAEIETRQHEVDVTLSLGSTPLMVEADAIQLEQVVLNLVRNACDAVRTLPPGTARRIRVDTGNGDGAVNVAVTDNGPGLSPEIATHIFDPFVTSKSDGLGLGLAISRTIVEAHGGRLDVDTQPPDGATAFRFRLPHAPEA